MTPSEVKSPHDANEYAVAKAGEADGAWNTRYAKALKEVGYMLAKDPPAKDYATLMPPIPLMKYPDRYLYPSVIVPINYVPPAE